MLSTITSIDFAILFWIQEHIRTTTLDIVFPFLSTINNVGLFWIVLSVVLLLFRRTRLCGICMLVCLAVDCALGEGLIKHLFMRERPCNVIPLDNLLIPKPLSSSFPSGHTASSFTASTAIFYNHKRAGIVAYSMAVLIAFSRLYCYVHYPTDVLAGMLLGICVGCFLTPRIQKRLSDK